MQEERNAVILLFCLTLTAAVCAVFLDVCWARVLCALLAGWLGRSALGEVSR